jgi:hypothetical protein
MNKIAYPECRVPGATVLRDKSARHRHVEKTLNRFVLLLILLALRVAALPLLRARSSDDNIMTW